MNKGPLYVFVLLIITFFYITSCSDEDLYKGVNNQDNNNGKTPEPKDSIQEKYIPYLYPYEKEVQNPIVEIIITSNDNANLNNASVEIPKLKYNKSWLFMLTQDDCVQSAFCRTWAAINGKPISSLDSHANYFYDIEHLAALDLPPACYSLENTLGSTDGCGNEVRFHITTTLAPEWSFMNANTDVKYGYTDNYYRFYMKSGLRWNNIKEMLNFGTGIAIHDVNTTDLQNIDSIARHFSIAQDIITTNLSSRGAKMLAEPNGNKNYIAAAKMYNSIQTITAQSEAERLYPFLIDSDLKQIVISRTFKDDPEDFKSIIQEELLKSEENREIVHAGVHNTDNKWINFLYWLNNTFGKDGDDSIWFPSQEEYYEYNYYRIHSKINTTVNQNTLKVRIEIPTEKYFYYPSLSINIKDIDTKNIRSVSSNETVTGMTFGIFNNTFTVNIDCRKFLIEQAEHYVKIYENKPTAQSLSDAKYFANQLKESVKKEELLSRLGL